MEKVLPKPDRMRYCSAQRQTNCNNWTMSIITRAIRGADRRLRKVEVKTIYQGHSRIYLRPVTELVLILNKSPS